MTVSVGAYVLCDGTLENGVAVSDLRLSQRRIADVVPVIPSPYRISLAGGGAGYATGDLLQITVDDESAGLRVTGVGLSGNVTTFYVLANTFTEPHTSVSSTGGGGSGAAFSATAFVQPNASSPLVYDRTGRPCLYSFTVKRTHADADAAEQFIIGLEDAIPAEGVISVTTSGPSPADFEIPNAKVQSHDLIDQLGATTFHTYAIIGGPPPTET